ncbi:MAG: flippase-like domain-containing protein [Actinobacteria bacterium]|nr:flippase-like domain-containing protein [Actinomycetota bacterium]
MNGPESADEAVVDGLVSRSGDDGDDTAALDNEATRPLSPSVDTTPEATPDPVPLPPIRPPHPGHPAGGSGTGRRDPRPRAGSSRPQHSTPESTVVIEGDIAPRRLRRPADLLRLALAVLAAALVLGLSYVASGTTSGLESDLTEATGRIPTLILDLTSWVGVLGAIALPVGISVSLLVRRRGRLLLDALAALLLALLIGALLMWIINDYGSPQLLQALTGRNVRSDTMPLNAFVSGLVAMSTVARLVERPRWAVASILVITAIAVLNIVGATLTVIGLLISLLLGWSVGLLMRYSVGTPSTRPSGLDVARTLEANGYPLSVLRASSVTRGGRRYSATSRAGQRLDVLVLDRDLEGDGLVPVAWRSLRIRQDDGGNALTMRGRLEHSSLQAYASQIAGAATPRLLVVCQVGPDAALLAFETIDAEPFAACADNLTDGDLDRAWVAVKRLQDHHVSHRTLSADNILRDSQGGVWLVRGEEGSVAAGDVSLRLDLAEMLCTLALLTSAERAVDSGLRVLGRVRLGRALPALQAVGLSPATRHAMRKRKSLMNDLRDKLLNLNPGQEPEQINIERLKPRTLLTIVAGTVAGYVLLTQLARVNIAELASQADWKWAVVGLLLSVSTYVGAAMSLSGFVPEKISLIKTMLAQLAASFATLVSPPTLGAVAVNVRYLQKIDLHPALAAASVGVSQVMAFVMHIVLLLGFGVLAGTQTKLDVPVPAWALIIGAILIAALILGLVLPFSRAWLRKRVQPIVSQVGPRLLTLTQRPAKLAEGIGGILLLNLSYCLCLAACVKAFGGEAGIAAIAVVYLAGATLGQAAPTPGGLGAVELALSAGLTAAGVEGGIAVSSVLLFRLLTFWLPTIPGWFSFNWMTKNNLL